MVIASLYSITERLIYLIFYEYQFQTNNFEFPIHYDEFIQALRDVYTCTSGSKHYAGDKIAGVIVNSKIQKTSITRIIIDSTHKCDVLNVPWVSSTLKQQLVMDGNIVNWFGPNYDTDDWISEGRRMFEDFYPHTLGILGGGQVADLQKKMRLSRASQTTLVPLGCGGHFPATRTVYIKEICTTKSNEIMDCVTPTLSTIAAFVMPSIVDVNTTCMIKLYNNCSFNSAAPWDTETIGSCRVYDIIDRAWDKFDEYKRTKNSSTTRPAISTTGTVGVSRDVTDTDDDGNSLTSDQCNMEIKDVDDTDLEALLMTQKTNYYRSSFKTGGYTKSYTINGHKKKSITPSPDKNDHQDNRVGGYEPKTVKKKTPPPVGSSCFRDDPSFMIRETTGVVHAQDPFCTVATGCSDCYQIDACMHCTWCSLSLDYLLPMFLDFSDYWNLHVLKWEGSKPYAHIVDMVLSHMLKLYMKLYHIQTHESDLAITSPIMGYRHIPYYAIPASSIFGKKEYCQDDPYELCGSARWLIPKNIEIRTVDCEIALFFAKNIMNQMQLNLPPNVLGSKSLTPANILKDTMTFEDVMALIQPQSLPGFCIPGHPTLPGISSVCHNEETNAIIDMTRHPNKMIQKTPLSPKSLKHELSVKCDIESGLMETIYIYYSKLLVTPDTNQNRTTKIWVLLAAIPLFLCCLAVIVIEIYIRLRKTNSLTFIGVNQ